MMIGTDGSCSWTDFQRRDLVVFEYEEEPKVHGAAGEIAGEAAGEDGLSILLLGRERLTRVCVFRRTIGLPFLDRGQAVVGVTFVFHDGLFRETPGNSLAVTFVRGEIGGDGFG